MEEIVFVSDYLAEAWPFLEENLNKTFITDSCRHQNLLREAFCYSQLFFFSLSQNSNPNA